MKILYIYIGTTETRKVLIDHTFNRWQLIESEHDQPFTEPDLSIQLRLYTDYKQLLITLRFSRYKQTINKVV